LLQPGDLDGAIRGESTNSREETRAALAAF
jgi:hypothetical protein